MEEVQKGDRLVIENAGRPVAVLTAFNADPEPRPMGGWKDQDVWIAEDFDAPLPPEIQATFQATFEDNCARLLLGTHILL